MDGSGLNCLFFPQSSKEKAPILCHFYQDDLREGDRDEPWEREEEEENSADK